MTKIPNKSNNIAMLIKDETRTCMEYSYNLQHNGVKIPLKKKPSTWPH